MAKETTNVTELTQILQDATDGKAGAADQLAAVLYEELKDLARRGMVSERADHTLQPTALVHEAYVRLLGPEGTAFDNRAHFLGAAARAMRRVLVDHARKRHRIRRGGGALRLELDEEKLAEPIRDDTLLALDEAVDRMAAFDPGRARIVELRFFAGMTVPEVATSLGVSESTVARGWRLAKAWLRGELEEPDGP
jgi:RNA polymerase sigma factor (TIGR02999 family)